jgi:hypothetical protein
MPGGEEGGYQPFGERQVGVKRGWHESR